MLSIQTKANSHCIGYITGTGDDEQLRKEGRDSLFVPIFVAGVDVDLPVVVGHVYGLVERVHVKAERTK